jgi:hypothetical protein
LAEIKKDTNNKQKRKTFKPTIDGDCRKKSMMGGHP